MAERPMLFSAPMVRALLAGTKTQTRRVWKMPPGCQWYAELGGEPEGWVIDPGQPWWLHVGEFRCPYGQPGDRLWVRETFFAFGRWETRYSAKKGRDERHFADMTLECGQDYLYAADGVRDTQAFIKRRSDPKPMYWKRPAIFMPRWASRIMLEITDVRVERLQDISEADAEAEGVHTDPACPAYDAYAALWDQINGAGAWDGNPWVWAISFKQVQEAANG